MPESERQHRQPDPPVLLFTGHRIDAPGRERPRFPAAAEPAARRLIRDAVERERATGRERPRGIAGAASGGDILFHEICAELGIPTRILLPMPADEYVRASVADAGAGWVERFERLTTALPTRVLGSETEPPAPATGADDAPLSPFARGNLRMLEEALAHGADSVALIALWDGRGGDGPGGTADLVERARRRGVRVVVLDAGRLLAGSAKGDG